MSILSWAEQICFKSEMNSFNSVWFLNVFACSGERTERVYWPNFE